MPARPRTTLIVLLTSLVAGCVTNRSRPSLWPPEDFSVRVAGSYVDEDAGRRVHQRFRVMRDGFAIYREATELLPTDALEMHVFDTVAVYRIKPESVRTMGRLLGRAQMFGTDVGQLVNRRGGDSEVVVHWTGGGNTGQLSSHVDSAGVLDRVVNVLNAYLPEGCAFEFPELSGEREIRRASQVPPPLRWAEGSLRCHESFVELFEDDVGLWLDLFSLAFVERDVDVAEAAFERIIEGGADGWSAGPTGFVDWERDCVQPLRELLAAMPRESSGAGGGEHDDDGGDE